MDKKFGDYAKKKFDQRYSRAKFETYYEFRKDEEEWRLREGVEPPKTQMDTLFARYRAQPITRSEIVEMLRNILRAHNLLTEPIEEDLASIAGDLAKALIACLHGHTLTVPFGYTLPFEVAEYGGCAHAMLSIRSEQNVHQFSCITIDEGIEGVLESRNDFHRIIPESCKLRTERRESGLLVLVSG